METFWSICSGVRNTLSTPEVPKKRPESPPSMAFLYDCSNFLCIETSKTAETWKRLKWRKRTYRFCSQCCFEEWLESPGSPDILGKEPKAPPYFELNPE
tara:strand:+ start:615 stop:911 length:297 start_codon:yes stop_codon:yes gene_type:complete